MRLEIKNIGKISEVDLCLNGITVIAGNNNTGKSTIGKSLFGLFQSFNDLSEQIDIQKQSLSYSSLYRIIQNELDNEMGYEDAYFVTKKVIDALNNANNDKTEVVKKYLKQTNVESEDVVKKVIKEFERIESFPTDILIKRVVTNVFQRLFFRSVNSISEEGAAYVKAEITGKLLQICFKEDICTEYKQDINILNKAIYIDDPFVLDDLDNKLAMQYARKTLIEQMCAYGDELDGVLKRSIAEERASEALAVFDTIGLGDVYTDEAGDYKYRDSNMDIPISNTSAGIKSFAILKTLLTNGSLTHKDILILDEPEIHLHPEWQLKYAQLIVCLQKALELTVVITTHSQVFLEAINLYSRKYDIVEKCNYYFASNNEINSFIEVTDRLDYIYTQMVNPSIELDKLRWELEANDNE